VIFFSNIIKAPRVLKGGAYIKKREKEKEKLQGSLQIKGEANISREENTSSSKILFDVIPFSPPPSYHFKKSFPKSMRKFS
jgi:hypothetical protein